MKVERALALVTEMMWSEALAWLLLELSEKFRVDGF